MISDTIQSLLKQHLPLKSTPNGWMKCNCVVCHTKGHRPDKRQRLGVYFSADNAIAINCFNCKFSSVFTPGKNMPHSFVNFLSLIGVDEYTIKKIQLEALKEAAGHTNTEEIFIKKEVQAEWKVANLPKDSYNFRFWLENNCNDENFIKVLEYSIKRNIFDYDKLFWSPETRFQMNKRVLLPFYYRHNIVGYTGRLCEEVENKKIPKYYNQMPVHFVYNLDEQIYDNKYCILCEGVLDAYSVNGISVMGTINKEQINIINSLKKEVIVSPDRDRAGKELIDVAIEQGWSVSFPDWGNDIKDAASASEKYGRIFTLHSIIESREHKEFNIRLKRKMDNFKEE